MAISRPSYTKKATTASSLTSSSSKKASNNKPKRPLSAYNLYFQLERERLLQGTDTLELPVTPDDVARISRMHKAKGKRPHRKSHGKISFLDLARTIADRWKTVDSAVKKVCDDQAVLEKQEYDEKMKEWQTSQGDCNNDNENESMSTEESSEEEEDRSQQVESVLLLSSALEHPYQRPSVLLVNNPLAPARQTSIHSHSFVPVSPYPHQQDEFMSGADADLPPQGIKNMADYTEHCILKQFGLDSLNDGVEPILFYSVDKDE